MRTLETPHTKLLGHRWFFGIQLTRCLTHKGLRLRSAVQSSCRRNTLPVTTFSRLGAVKRYSLETADALRGAARRQDG